MHSRIDSSFTRTGPRTSLDTLHEAGALRLRLPRGPSCVATLVNTGGGLVAGDRVEMTLTAHPGADLALTSVAAEKVYRAGDAAITCVTTHLNVAENAALAWLPQETILFDGARLDRRLTVHVSGTSTFLGAEMLVFGRLAAGETAMSGLLRDRWRIRRNAQLIFADESALEGAIGALLDRPALGGGARAVGLIVRIGTGQADHLDGLRAVLEARVDKVEAGASLVGDVLVGRLLARSPADLRDAMVEALQALGAIPMQRIWT